MHLQTRSFFISWVAVGVFQIAAPEMLRPLPLKMTTGLIPKKQSLKKPIRPIITPAHTPHSPTLLDNHGSTSHWLQEQEEKKSMFVFCSLPHPVILQIPSLIKLSVLHEVCLYHHQSVGPPSFRNPWLLDSDGSACLDIPCVKSARILFGIVVWFYWFDFDFWFGPAPISILDSC